MDITCCIVGGGPAGMMAGFLLARAGIDVVVLEKHADFLRDFRGDTVHPSTLELMHELGLLDEFLREPHSRIEHLRATIGDTPVTLADFRHLPVACPYIVLVPQWNFLDFLARHARAFPGFHLRMEAEVTGLLTEAGQVTGVQVRAPDGPLEVRAKLTLAADGRESCVREAAGIEVEDLGAPIDVLWMRLSRESRDGGGVLAHFGAGKLFVTIDRGGYWQCAYVIPKGSAARVQERGIEALRAEIVEVAPQLSDRVHELATWEDVKLLTVKVDRLREWYRPGLLVIGDAAHAMSPIGGVGINLAIQDAVAAANILADPLYEQRVTTEHLAQVQRRRELPTRMTQAAQVLLQNRLLTRVLGLREKPRPPAFVRLIDAVPLLQRIPARLVGLGFRPEHVRSPHR